MGSWCIINDRPRNYLGNVVLSSRMLLALIVRGDGVRLTKVLKRCLPVIPLDQVVNYRSETADSLYLLGSSARGSTNCQHFTRRELQCRLQVVRHI